jgi:hypothetical protein
MKHTVFGPLEGPKKEEKDRNIKRFYTYKLGFSISMVLNVEVSVF